MRKILLTLLAAVLAAGQIMAVPARRKPFTVRQADGTSLTLRLVGDECFHYYMTADGVPVSRAADGNYYYAELADGRLRASGRLAHDAAVRSADEAAFVGAQAVAADALSAAARKARAPRNEARKARAAARRQGAASRGVTGQRKGLVILVNFSDRKMQAGSTRQEFYNMLNQEGYSKNGNSGSVRDYFKAQSYGRFELDFDVVGPVTLTNNMAYYGGNDAYGDDLRPGEMAAEACKAADAQVDFSDYDWDGDGVVEQVYIIYAGYGEASGAPENTVWPHEWQLSYSDYGRALTLDGVTVDTYACGSELYGSEGTDIDGIGTMCHEFSHCLGLPDFYDTGSAGNFGMDSWSLMDYGCYNGDGYAPCGYTSYERWYSGWLEPTELTTGCRVEGMKALTDAPEAYVIYNDADRDEYYLLENRQLRGSDAEGYGHGLLVLHVDYDAEVWAANEVNNSSSHQRLTIVPADNQFKTGSYDGVKFATEADLAGDPFPGTSGNNALTDTSRPAARLFNAAPDGRKLLGKPVEDIRETAGGLVSFTFMGGNSVGVPAPLPVEDVSATGFTARWQAVEGADSYVVELTERSAASPAENVVAAEDFSTFEGASNGTDLGTDIGASLDDYFTQKGWTGEKLYSGPARLKLGSSKKAGSLVSPLFETPAQAAVTVRLSGDAFKEGEDGLTVRLLSATGAELASRQLTLDGEEAVVSFDGVTADYKVAFASTKRAYLYAFGVYDGNYSADDFADAPAAAPARAAQTPTVVEGITGTSHTFTGLTPGGIYTYRVRAVAGDELSAWSALMRVQLSGSTGIGVLRPAEETAPAAVYDLSGRRVAKPASGLYIIGGRKVLVK